MPIKTKNRVYFNVGTRYAYVNSKSANAFGESMYICRFIIEMPHKLEGSPALEPTVNCFCKLENKPN